MTQSSEPCSQETVDLGVVEQQEHQDEEDEDKEVDKQVRVKQVWRRVHHQFGVDLVSRLSHQVHVVKWISLSR